MAIKRLFVDMDGTLVRFHDEDLYLERMYEKGFFRNLLPFENVVSGVKCIISEHPEVEVYSCSSVIQSPYCVDEKNAWLDQHKLDIDLHHRLFPDIGTPKYAVIPGGVTPDDYLLDDYNNGLYSFMTAGGSAIKIRNNINQKGLGAYGGDKGSLWCGKLVDSSDSPGLLADSILRNMEVFGSMERNCGKAEVKNRESSNAPDRAEDYVMFNLQTKSAALSIPAWQLRAIFYNSGVRNMVGLSQFQGKLQEFSELEREMIVSYIKEQKSHAEQPPCLWASLRYFDVKKNLIENYSQEKQISSLLRRFDADSCALEGKRLEKRDKSLAERIYSIGEPKKRENEEKSCTKKKQR